MVGISGLFLRLTTMKKILIVIAFIVLGAGAFVLGRVTSDWNPCKDSPSEQVAQPTAAQPAPAARPSPAPAPQAAANQAPQTFPVSPMSDRPVPRQIAIPEGTKPATDASPSRGSKDAPVVFIEISDFQCPVCKRAHEGLAQLAADYPDKVRHVFKNNALEMHPNAMSAAAAAMAAARQGKFWEYADILFQNQRALTESDLMGYASSLKLDMTRFRKDFEDPALRQRIKTEGNIAMELEARGTPAFLVNGKLQVGWASYGAVKQQVENEAAAVEALVASGMSVVKAREERTRINQPKHEKLLNTPLGIEISDR